MFPTRCLPFALAALLLAGCDSLPPELAHLPGLGKPPPAYAPRNFSGVAQLPRDLRRVVLLPLSGGRIAEPESTAQLDPVFLAALQQEQRFEVVTLDRPACRAAYGAGDFPSTDALPAGFFNRLATDFAADAVLFVDLTAFQPYRPLALGVRAKLVALRSRQVLWSYDELLSLSDPLVAASAGRAANRGGAAAQPANYAQSPAAFAAFAAATAFGTLPPR